MTPELQAVVDRIMGLALRAIHTFSDCDSAEGEDDRRFFQSAYEKSTTALRTAIEELAQQAAEAQDDYMRLLREKQARTLAALASQPLVPAGRNFWVPAGYMLVPVDSAVAQLEGAATRLRELWYEHEAARGNRGGEYHEGLLAGLDAAENEVRAMLSASPAVQEAPPSMTSARAIVDKQAEDEGLWFLAETASEAYLQAALRELHAAVEEAPAERIEDFAERSGGRESREDEIESAYWRFDARRKGCGQWRSAPMSERDAFKAEMRNAVYGWARREPQEAPAAEHAAEPTPAGLREAAKQARELIQALWDQKPLRNGVWVDGLSPRLIDQIHSTTRSLDAALSAPEQAAQSPELAAEPPELTTGAEAAQQADAESRAMFVARLERLQADGDKWLTIESVLALLNDCDMLAVRAAMAASKKEG